MGFTRPSSDTPAPTAGHRKGLKTGKSTKGLPRGESRIQATTINTLPGNVLLEIFDFYRRNQDLHRFHFHYMWDWHRLAHICQRWRSIIFSSPRRLGLQLLCTRGTPVRRNLRYWPSLPLIVDYQTYPGADESESLTPSDEDNLVAALGDSARVGYLGMPVTRPLLEKMATAVWKPFPALTHLRLSSKDEDVPTLPDDFLGGCAPVLQVAHFEGIPIPVLPTPLLSALGLVDLRLLDIPHVGCISPEAVVESLATLTGLRTLLIGFKSPAPPSKTRCQDPIMRTSLPHLTTFGFHGVKDYLEDLVVQIDTPQLDYFRISYFNQLDFRVPQLSKFIGRTQNLNLARFRRARVDFGDTNVYVSLYCEREELLESHFSLQIACRGLDWQVSHVAQTLNQIGAMLFNVDDLSINARDLPAGGKDFMDDSEWLELFRPFTAVETLHVSEKLARYVSRGLECVTEEMSAEMLPILRSLYLEDEPLTSVEQFIAVRRLSDHPVASVDTAAPGECFARPESPSEFKVKTISHTKIRHALCPNLRAHSVPHHRAASIMAPVDSDIKEFPRLTSTPSLPLLIGSHRCSSKMTHRLLSLPDGTISLRSSSRDTSIPTTDLHNGLAEGEIKAPSQSHRHATTINLNIVPDSVLLEIFDLYRMGHDAHGSSSGLCPILKWRTLVHVCKRWRHIVFASPLRLDLRLLCTHGTPVKKNLSFWPPIPLIIDYNTYWGGDKGKSLTPSDEDNIVAALVNPNRVRYVKMSVTNSLLGKMATAVKVPFPMLTHLWLSSEDANVPVLSEAFMGGSAPRLLSAHLERIPFPAFPTLLLSATDLVDLQLLNIPKTGFVSQDALVTGLAALTSLETLSIEFQSPHLDRRLLLPLTPIRFPCLTNFTFRGVSEYLEDLVAQIDTPLLNTFTATYFNQLSIQIPQLSQFISRTQGLDLSRFKCAQVDFGGDNVYVQLDCNQEKQPGSHFTLGVSCQRLDWQVAHMAQVLSQCFAAATLTSVDDLSINAHDLQPGWEDDVDPTEWASLLRLFTAVEMPHSISIQLAKHIWSPKN